MSQNTRRIDNKILEFRRYANRVMYHVEKKYPKATIDPKLLMHLFIMNVGVLLAKDIFVQKHKEKGGQ
jgi:hypothetical protein